MRITTLGPLAVDGRPVRGERLAGLIRELLGARGRAVSTAALVEAVWHGTPPEDAHGAVQALISRVRRLGVTVEATAGGYRIPPERVETDVAAARSLTDKGRALLQAGDAAGARAVADEARALFPEVPELHEAEPARLFGEVAALRAEAALAGSGGFEEADLRLLARRTPPDEPAAALLIRALAAQGRDAEALDVYEQLRAELADRYGSDPSPVLAEAHLALLRGELSLAVPRPAPPRSALPASWRRPGTALVGREPDLAAVTAGLTEAPLVTIVATGGAGKTRLAAEVARTAPGAVRVVELAGVRTPEEVLPAFLVVLGAAETTVTLSPERRVLTPRERLSAVGPELTGLIVVDNCEHVLDAVARVVADLLATAPEVAVLATSRAPLGLAGEVVHRLEALPDDRALDLLQARARAGGAVPTWDSVRALRLCHRLDNLPLALELAAARLRHMPIDDVLAGLGDRFALLDDALRGLPERHASLWAMVDWSRELLAPAEQELLQRLAVIPAPFTADLAAAVAGRPEVRRGLAVLVEQSLLVLEDGHGGPPRYRMLETVREYGDARLPDRAPALDGLLGWARTTAVALLEAMISPRQLDVLNATARDAENLVGALRWAIESGDELAAVDVATLLFHLWSVRGLHLEAGQWAQQLMRLDDPAARARSVIAHPALPGVALPDADRLTWLCLLIAVNGGIAGPDRLVAAGARSLRTLLSRRGDEISRRWRLLGRAIPALDGFNPVTGLREADLLIAEDDPYVRGMGLFARGAILENSGEPEAAAEQAQRAYTAFEAAGDHWGMAMAAQILGNSAALRSDTTAVGWLSRSVRHMDLLGAAQDARSLRIMLDVRLALDGDADAEHRLRKLTPEGPQEDWDEAQAGLGLATLAMRRDRWGEALTEVERVARRAYAFKDPAAQARIMFRTTAAVFYLMVAAGMPVPGADERATGLLASVRPDISDTREPQLTGAWAIGGARLAEHRGRLELARELWRCGSRIGGNFASVIPIEEIKRLGDAFGGDRKEGLPVEQAAARIREIMDDLLRPSSGTPGAPAA